MTARIIQPMIDQQPPVRLLRLPRNRERVNRQLFGPVNHEETQAFLARELGEEQRFQAAKWNFDFNKGVPLPDSPAGYNWKVVRLVAAPGRPKRAQTEPDIGHLYAHPLPGRRVQEDEEEESNENEENEQRQEEGISQAQRKKEYQTKMTDFMRETRKRSNILTRKPTESVIPAKISKYNNC